MSNDTQARDASARLRRENTLLRNVLRGAIVDMKVLCDRMNVLREETLAAARRLEERLDEGAEVSAAELVTEHRVGFGGDCINPDWKNVTRVHDWRNYVPDRVVALWDTFTDAQKIAIAEMADERASSEHWD